MAASKRTKSKPNQRVQRFREAKGKVVSEVEVSISPDFNIIEIIFEDKTSLGFEIVPSFQVVPELVSWKTGNYKPIRRWPIIRG
jgi:hypothetical protein